MQAEISHLLAIEKAEKEYDMFQLKTRNKIESNFDKAIKKIEVTKTKKKK